MLKLNGLKIVFLVLVGLVTQVLAQGLPCMFYFPLDQGNICLNLRPDPDAFKPISASKSIPVADVNLYFWLEDEPENFLAEDDLNALGFSRVSVLMDMSHMLSLVKLGASTCLIRRAKKIGQWLEDENGRNAYQFYSAVQSGVYYAQVSLVREDNSFINMQRPKQVYDETLENFKNYLDKYDKSKEIDVNFLPLEITHYFGVAATQDPFFVALYLKP
ncbi:MAG TPA: hypothetical protein PKC21_05105 [Oligoflexia bacterium]|nr:hypothetical protein [Oligoflexia bacterium]HMR24714.1 hypothetical protein [Oligoflexia bacterium]